MTRQAVVTLITQTVNQESLTFKVRAAFFFFFFTCVWVFAVSHNFYCVQFFESHFFKDSLKLRV